MPGRPSEGCLKRLGLFYTLIHRSYKNPRTLSTSSPCSEPSYGSPQLLPSTQPPQMPTLPPGPLHTQPSSLAWNASVRPAFPWLFPHVVTAGSQFLPRLHLFRSSIHLFIHLWTLH